MSDYIVNAITSNGAIRVVAADTTQLCNRAQEIHKMSATAAAALGRTITAAAIMGSMLKVQRMLLQFSLTAVAL